MKRREFIIGGGATLALPAVAKGQPAVPVVGFLNGAPPNEKLANSFQEGLGDTGFFNGKNVSIEYRWAGNEYDRLPEMAADLVRSRVAVIFAGSATVAPRAAKAATSTIPIVFYIGGDPINLGLVTSFGRPEANVTGVTGFGHAVVTKRLELLREFLPRITSVAMLVRPSNPNTTADLDEGKSAERALGLRIVVVRAEADTEFDGLFANIREQHAEAVFVANDAVFFDRRASIIEAAAKYGIPAIYGQRTFVEAGGLMSYGSDTVVSYRQAGVYVGRILKGAKPADLPVLLPTKFEFVLNLKTAKALGLDVPYKLQAFADEVIE